MDRDSRIAIYESTSATSTETRAKITKSLRSRAPASTDILCMPRFARINRLPRIDRGWNYRTTFEVKIERRERRSQLMGESCLCIDASDTAGSNDNSFPRLDFPPRWYRSLTAVYADSLTFQYAHDTRRELSASHRDADWHATMRQHGWIIS